MQYLLRPYLTTGIAVAGAGIIAISPVAPVTLPLPASGVEFHSVQLTDAWSDLFTDTTTNVNSIIAGANWADISKVIGEFFTNPLGVIGAFTNITPDVTTDLSSLPATISVQLPPGLELAISSLGAQIATNAAIQQVISEAGGGGGFGALFNGLPTILNAYLNGADNVSLLGGIINIPLLNGVLSPIQTGGVIDLSLTKLVDALGLGNLKLTDLNLSSLLNQLGLGNLDLGGLFQSLGLSGKGLGDLLGDPTLGGLLGDLGLGDLGLGKLSLTGILSGLGLDTSVDLNSLSLDTVLNAFGIDPTASIGGSLVQLLTNLGFGGPTGLLSEGLGTVLSSLLGNPLQDILNNSLTGLNGVVDSVLTSVLGAGTIAIINTALQPLGLSLSGLLTSDNLMDALNTVTVGSLLGGQSINETVSSLLGALGISVPGGDLSIGGILGALGFSSATGDLSLSDLLGGVGGGLLNLNVGDLLNGLNLGDLLNDLGLSNLPLDLSNLGDLSGLTLGGLLGDLGLGDLANISVDPFGGFYTELFDTIPQQILAALS